MTSEITVAKTGRSMKNFDSEPADELGVTVFKSDAPRGLKECVGNEGVISVQELLCLAVQLCLPLSQVTALLLR